MAKVLHYIPDIPSKFICSKGGMHAQQPLNLVCLDPLCRNDPLGCSVCFVNTHKHHKVIGIEKFIDDYARNVRSVNGGRTMRKIQKHHQEVKNLIAKVREDMNRELDDFEESIDDYADQMRSKTNMRDYISKSLGIPLDPRQLKQSKNNSQFVEVLKFILNNSLFDNSKNMIRIADVLKQDEQKIFSLLDKMVNMTEHCQAYIKDVMRTLNFSDNTLKQQKVTFKKQLQKMKITQNQFDLKEYKQKQIVNQSISHSIQLNKPHWHQSLYMMKKSQKGDREVGEVKFSFSDKNKHQMIEVKDRFSVGVSNITALKPQYALLTPHLNTNPTFLKEWTLKVNNCRNFASESTMGVGLATFNDLNSLNFEGHFPKNATMLTSQGYVIEDGKTKKTNMIFGTGDILYCRYDPLYKLFEISKQNGRKISLTVDRPQNEDLFICVRLTYASDQVQVL